MTAPRQRTSKELKGWHVLIWMLVFFGVMFAVNGVFLYYALTTHPGEQVEKSYLQGLNYNATLEARAHQEELGWTSALGVVEQTGDVPLLVAQMTDRADAPLNGLAVTASLHRHTTADAPVLVTLTAVSSGEYAARMEGLPSGTYDVILQARSAGAETVEFEAHKRLYLP